MKVRTKLIVGLICLLLLNFLSLGTFAYFLIQMDGFTDLVESGLDQVTQESQLDQLARSASRYDGAMSKSAGSYTSTGNKDHLVRYEQMAARLNILLDEAINISEGENQEFFRGIKQAALAFIALEKAAMQGGVSLKELSDPTSYDAYKKRYHENLGKYYTSRLGDLYDDLSLAEAPARHVSQLADNLLSASALAAILLLTAAVVLSTLLWLYLRQAIDQPLAHLKQLTTSVKLGSPLPVESSGLSPEFASVADAIRSMSERLHTSYRKLRRLYHKAKQSVRLKDEFLATVSHELRTPMAVIVGWSEILSKEMSCTEDVKRIANIILRNAEHEMKLVNDLLDVSRLVRGSLKLEAEPVDLGPLLQQVCDNAALALAQKEIKLKLAIEEGAIKAMGDPTRLRQVFWNLLSNAIKFTQREGEITVSLQKVHSKAVIKVRDTGVGIEPEFIPILFERFRSYATDSAKAAEGMGLGLSIVKELVQLHGGQVKAFSKGKGQGATFTVLLPLAAVNAAGEKDAHDFKAYLPSKVFRLDQLEPVLRGTKVLLVDDVPDILLILGKILERYGAKVEVAGSATEALKKLETFKPDVLISDLSMPDQDGYELIRRIRVLPGETGAIPAAALSAYGSREDRRKALSAGFQVHLVKPVQVDDLLSTIRNLAKSA